MEKVLLENDATPDLLKEQFFSKQADGKDKKAAGESDVKTLKTLLKLKNPYMVNEYLKSLSPSGIELEFLSLSTFDLDNKTEEGQPLYYVSTLITRLKFPLFRCP